MGSSPSKSVLRQAQVQILGKCEFCNTDKDLIYKCNQCQVYTCNKCGIIHLQAFPTHYITEIGSYSPQPMQLRPESERQSKSALHQAQVQVLRKCRFCEIEIDVDYMCEQCQVYSCNLCRIIHYQSSPNHNITEIGSNTSNPVKLRTESVNPALVFSNCGLCLTDIKALNKCTKCQIYLCFKCNTIHQQLFHSINNIITSVSPTKRCACEIHKILLNNNSYICLKKPVCSECISGHREYQLLSLAHQTLILQGRLSKDSAFTSLLLTQIFKQTFENNLKFKNMLEEVEQRENSLDNNTTNHTKLRENMKEEQRKFQTYFTYHKYKIYTFKHTLESLQSKLQAAKGNNNEEEMSIVLLESISSLQDFPFNAYLKRIEKFIPKKTIETARSIGIQVEERKTQSNIKMKLLRSYETNLISIQKLITLNNKKALITDFQSENLHEVHITENIITCRELPIMVRDMSVTPNKEILVNLVNYNALCLLTKEGTKPFLSVTPHQTFICCVHVTKNNEIILGLKDYCPIESLLKFGNKSNTKLMIFGMDKKQKQCYEYKANKLFTTPYRIATNINNEILVIDRMSMYDGKLITLNREGQVRWIYKGHPRFNSGYELFDPTDIVTTNTGQIIVVDHFNHVLHALSEEGDLLQCIFLKIYGILFPMSLDIASSEKLWIGCRSDSQAKKAKLHIINISFN